MNIGRHSRLRGLAMAAFIACLSMVETRIALCLESTSAPTSSDPDEDPDGDGLFNQEETEAGTLPFNAYSDADDKMDGQDGWPLDSGVTFPRIRETSYAVLDLNEQGAQWVQRITDSGLVWGRFDPYEGKIWRAGQLTALPSSHNDFSIYWTDMNQDGTVVGYGMNRDVTWDKVFTFSDGEITELPRYPSAESPMYITVIEGGIFITDNNDIYRNIYVAEDIQGQGSITHKVTAGIVKWTGNSPVLLTPGQIVRTTETFPSSPPVGSVTPDPPYLLIAESVFKGGVAIGNTNRIYFDNNDHQFHEEAVGTGLYCQGSFRLANDFGAQSRFAAASDSAFPTIVGELSGGIALWQANPILNIIYHTENSITKIQGSPYDINNSGEIVGSSFTSPSQQGIDGQLVENGRVVDLSTRCQGFTVSYAREITNTGLILAAGYNYANQENSDNLLLVPADIAVDANRDGVIKFAGNYNSTDPQFAGKPQDKTTQNKPFRFWVNDDDDSSEQDHSGSSTKDSDSNTIVSLRDLEDFTRLYLNIGGLQDAIADGTISVGLEWLNVTGNPSVKVFQAAEVDGGDQYLKTDVAAGNQKTGTLGAALGTVSNGGTFKLPSSFWQADAVTGKPALSKDNPNRYLIFEGAGEGKGQLVMTFLKGSTRMGEGGGVWLDIMGIKKMYQSSEGNMFAGAPPGEAEQTVVCVHGWNMSPDGSRNYAETMFKRLWHRGFKGRFAYFRWNTYWITATDVIGTLTTQYFANYNNSEYIAWTQGAPALKSFVEILRRKPSLREQKHCRS